MIHSNRIDMGIEIPMDKRKRLTKILEKFIFPCLLLIYPLLWVNQGIDVSDQIGRAHV